TFTFCLTSELFFGLEIYKTGSYLEIIAKKSHNMAPDNLRNETISSIAEATTDSPIVASNGCHSSASGADPDSDAFHLRRPIAADGPAITRLIAACPPLDSNAAYCNLLQCTHFADFCIVAE